jgi:hypothetical protein
MKNLTLLTFLLTTFAWAEPYKILIITDREAENKANEFKEYLLTKPPFSKMQTRDLEIKIVSTSYRDLGCGNTYPGAPRVILCDDDHLSRMKAREEANLAMVFTSRASGGSGGAIPIASKDYPIQTMFHEMLHTYGCDDEYEYSESEAEIYCQNPRSEANGAYFQDRPPYASDSAARTTHRRDVPWMNSINQSTFITQGPQLGSVIRSTEPGEQILGVYRGGACQKKIPSWRPYPNSIMKGYRDDTVYPLYEEIIVKSIESKIGRRLDLRAPAALKTENCSPEVIQESIQDFSGILRKLAH